jgi:hypothetical protein
VTSVMSRLVGGVVTGVMSARRVRVHGFAGSVRDRAEAARRQPSDPRCCQGPRLLVPHGNDSVRAREIIIGKWGSSGKTIRLDLGIEASTVQRAGQGTSPLELRQARGYGHAA